MWIGTSLGAAADSEGSRQISLTLTAANRIDEFCFSVRIEAGAANGPAGRVEWSMHCCRAGAPA